jgi:hypothetical protein
MCLLCLGRRFVWCWVRLGRSWSGGEQLNLEILISIEQNIRELFRYYNLSKDSTDVVRLELGDLTTSVIRKLPSELPHSRLYLDDLFEIEEILEDEFAKLQNAQPIAFEYEIDGSLVITTHEELIEHGGSSCRFALNIVSADWRLKGDGVLSFYSTIKPRFAVPYALKEGDWALFGRVEQIFWRVRIG